MNKYTYLLLVYILLSLPSGEFKPYGGNIDCLFASGRNLCISLDVLMPAHAPDNHLSIHQNIREHGHQRIHTRSKSDVKEITGVIANIPSGSRAENVRVLSTQSHVYAFWIRYDANDDVELEPHLEYARKPLDSDSSEWSSRHVLYGEPHLNKHTVSMTASAEHVHLSYEVNAPHESRRLFQVSIDSSGTTNLAEIPLSGFAYPNIAVSEDSLHIIFVGTMLTHARVDLEGYDLRHDSNNVFVIASALGSSTWTEPELIAFTEDGRAHQPQMHFHKGQRSIAYLIKSDTSTSSSLIVHGTGNPRDSGVPPQDLGTTLLSVPDSNEYFVYSLGIGDAVFAHYRRGEMRKWRPTMKKKGLQVIQFPSLYRRDRQLYVVYRLDNLSERRATYEWQVF